MFRDCEELWSQAYTESSGLAEERVLSRAWTTPKLSEPWSLLLPFKLFPLLCVRDANYIRGELQLLSKKDTATSISLHKAPSP